jgi:putative transcriptional regulator
MQESGPSNRLPDKNYFRVGFVFDNINSMRCRLVLAAVFSSLICLARFQTTGERLMPGTILVASEKLEDPNFAETVVLLTRRDDNGGIMGVVLNHPAGITLAKAFPQMHANADPVFEGGPVSPDAVQALLRTSQKPENADHIVADIYSVVRKALLEKSLTDHLASSKFRVYLGYAGWGPGQLENEVRLGAWTTIHGVKYVFDSEPETLWQRLDRETHSQLAQDRRHSEPLSHATMEACRCTAPLFSLH